MKASAASLAAVLFGVVSTAQTPPQSPPQKLTLDEAVAIALKNNPRLSVERLNGLIADQITTEVRSGLFPNIVANTTAAGALNESRLAAGALNNPIIYNRYAAGTAVSQLITDFGRTSNLVESARLKARSQQETFQVSRAQVTLAVHTAFFSALRAAGVLRVAEQTVRARELVLDQVSTLARSNLRSTLDVSFSEVNLSEAKLAVLQSRNEQLVSLSDLSYALGYSRPQALEPQDVTADMEKPRPFAELMDEAMRNRPEIAALRLDRDAAARIAAAERKLVMPTVSALANMGVAPVHDDRMRDNYAAAGLNVSVPVFNGSLFSARRREAELRVEVLDQRLRELENQIAREVTSASLQAETAFEQIGLTQQLVRQATLGAELAQERYNLGLGSIVELSQAQLNQAAAEVRSTAARYDYLIRRSILNFSVGLLR